MTAATVRRIGFAYNPTNEAAIELSARASGWCQVRGIDEWQAQSSDLDRLRAELPTSDALVVLGGDGTFLRAARAVAEIDVPLLGINLGKVGFLSKAEASELESVLGKERGCLKARRVAGAEHAGGEYGGGGQAGAFHCASA